MTPAPDGHGPHSETHDAGPWRIVVRSIVGSVRRRLEDAWCVAPRVQLDGRLGVAFAVFDGLGGLPRGQEGAWAAADAMAATLDQGPGDDLLERLNRIVKATGGTTTAVVALYPRDVRQGEGRIVSIGDSSAYALVDGRAQRLNPHDSAGDGSLIDFLGRPRIGGHRTVHPVPAGTSLLLCTDGVDGVVGQEELDAVLRAPASGVHEALDSLFSAIERAGSPDNATVVLARRRTQS